MHERCAGCGRKFDRAPGYLLGSIYMNYGATALIVTATYFACYFTEVLTNRQLLTLLAAFCVAFPLLFFRHSRAIWMAFDQRWDPWPNEEEAQQEAKRANR